MLVRKGAISCGDGCRASLHALRDTHPQCTVVPAGAWKPAPDSYAFAAQQLGLPPERIMMVARWVLVSQCSPEAS